MNLLIKVLVRTVILLVIFVYCLFGIVLVGMGMFNYAKCERLETNYVICEQYETSLDLMIAETSIRFSLPIDWSNSKIYYRLKGTEVLNNNLYLQTDSKPVLYITGIDSWAIEYPIERVKSFIQGKGTSKWIVVLEKPLVSFISYLSICLLLGALVIGVSYYLDNKLLAKLPKSK